MSSGYHWRILFEDGHTNLHDDLLAEHLLSVKPGENCEGIDEFIHKYSFSKLKAMILTIFLTIITMLTIHIIA